MSKTSSRTASPAKSDDKKVAIESENEPTDNQALVETEDNTNTSTNSNESKKEKVEEPVTKATKKEMSKVYNKIDQNTTGLKTQAEKIKAVNEQCRMMKSSVDEIKNQVNASEVVLQNMAEDVEVLQQRMNNDTINAAMGKLIEARITQLEEGLTELKRKAATYVIPRKQVKENAPTASDSTDKPSVPGACVLCDGTHALADCKLFPTNLSRLQELRIRGLCRKCLNYKCDGKKLCPKATNECESCKGRQQPPASYHRKEVCLLDTWIMKRKNNIRERKDDGSSDRANSITTSTSSTQQQQPVQQIPQQAVQPMLQQQAPHVYPAYQAQQPAVQYYQPAMQQGQQQPMFVLANAPSQQMQSQQPQAQNYGQQPGFQQPQGSYNQQGSGQYFRQF